MGLPLLILIVSDSGDCEVLQVLVYTVYIPQKLCLPYTGFVWGFDRFGYMILSVFDMISH